MKILLSVIFLLTFSLLVFSQIWVQYWGLDRGNTKFAWGQFFLTRYDSEGNTYNDYVILDLSRDATYLLANSDNDNESNDADTLYTRVILINGDAAEGIANLTFSIDTVENVSNSGADSLELYIRKYYTRKTHAKNYFSKWYQIGGFLKSDTLYEFEIADSTSWWKPCNGIQFKIINAGKDADTLYVPNLGLYIR